MRRAKKKIYLIGSLANKNIPHIANRIREHGYEVFDQWWSPGPLADSYLGHYAKIRGMGYKETLQDYAAKNIFEFDKKHLLRADAAIMAMSAGKSAHLELGFFCGSGKPGYVLFDKEPSKVDIMYQFASDLFFNEEELFARLRKDFKTKRRIKNART
jgi:hypothetical protein